MFDDQVLALEKQECADIAANINHNNAAVALEDYNQWKQQADVALAAGRMAPPKRPYAMAAVVNLDASGKPHIEWSNTPVFVEPAPVLVPHPETTLTMTDSRGVEWVGKIVGQTAFGPAIQWTLKGA